MLNPKTLSKIKILFGVAAVIFLVWFLGDLIAAWSGFPKGADPFGHLTKIKNIILFWPHINWDYQWALGYPQFLWYAPLPYFLAVVWVKLTHLSFESSLIFLAFLSFSLIALGIFGLVATITRNYFAAILASLLALLSTPVWAPIMYGGTYPKTLANSFLLIAIWALVSLIQKHQNESSKTKSGWIITILFLSLTLQSHFLVGFFALLAFILIIFLLVPQFKEKFVFLVKLFIPAFFLSSYLYIPLILTRGRSSQFLGVPDWGVNPVSINSIINPNSTLLLDGKLSLFFPALISLAILLFVFLFVLAKSQSSQDKNHFVRLIFAFLIILIASLVYGLGHRFGLSGKFYFVGFPPDGSLFYLSSTLAILTGLLVSMGKFCLRQNKRLVSGGLSILLVASIAIYAVVFAYLTYNPHLKELGQKLSRNQPGNIEYESMQKIKVDPQEKHYRFATVIAEEAIWFNYIYKVPQERDYFSQGILIPDWRFWFEQVLWGKDKAKIKEHSQEQIRFQLDWFGVKWFTVPSESDQERYLDFPSDFQLISKYKPMGEQGLVDYVDEFIYQHPSSILSATHTPSLLVIGSKEAYSTFFRNLAPTNYNSSKIIPVRGKEYIDDYSLDELKRFSGIVLYEYKFKNTKKAWELLDKYVREGGGLILEVSNEQSVVDLKNLPEPFPTTRWQVLDQKDNWQFQSKKHPITEDIDFNLFSEPSYEGGPWKIRTAKEEDLRERSEAIVSIQDQPVVISRELGKGRMLFSGLNLPYHALSYANQEESKLLVQMIDWITNSPTNLTQPFYQAEFINPEERKITTADKTTGILFKEAYFKNWRAYQDKQKLKIYPAGPDLMYIPVGEQAASTDLIIKYQRSLAERLSSWLSILSLIILIIYCFEGLLFKPFLGKFLARINPFRGIKLSWLKEEE